jgi:hypothetical protein
MRVLVHPANEQDKVAAKWLLRRLPFQVRLPLFIFDSGTTARLCCIGATSFSACGPKSPIAVSLAALTFSRCAGLLSAHSVGSTAFDV